MGSAQLFDQAQVLANLDGDRELMQLLAATFVADAPRLLDMMRRALADSDPVAAARACHNTKGSVANFGADALVVALKTMEAACRRGALDEAAAMYAAVEESVNHLVAELRDVLPEASD